MADAAVGTTKKLIIPTEYLPTVYDKVTATAVIPQLIAQKPQLYNNEEMIFMTEKPRAQYVGEGAPKAASDWGFDTKPMQKFKLQTTIRMTEETVFASEDNIALLNNVFDAMGDSLGEGVDIGMIHAIDPHSGAEMENAKKVALAIIGNQLTMTDDLQADIDSLPDTIIENYDANGVAFDPLLANAMRKLRNRDGARLYPDIPMNLNNKVGNFEGLRSVTSKHVSGRSSWMADTGVRAIIGDWNMAEWGIIREMTLRKYEVGDPDNKGYDLSYKNEVAFRVEMLFAFGVAYDDAFAVLRTKSTDDGGDDDGGNDDDNSGTQTQSTKSSK